MANGVWKVGFLPGAISSGNPSVLPEATQCNSGPVAIAMCHNPGTGVNYWENVSVAPDTVPNATPSGNVANGIGERWVPCTDQILFQGNAAPDAHGNVYQQVFGYNIDANVVQQLTTNTHAKYSGFMFQAPEFNNNDVFFTVPVASRSMSTSKRVPRMRALLRSRLSTRSGLLIPPSPISTRRNPSSIARQHARPICS
jgi:hypothetical protein